MVVESASILGHVGILDCLRGGRVMALYIRIRRNHGYCVAVVGSHVFGHDGIIDYLLKGHGDPITGYVGVLTGCHVVREPLEIWSTYVRATAVLMLRHLLWIIRNVYFIMTFSLNLERRHGEKDAHSWEHFVIQIFIPGSSTLSKLSLSVIWIRPLYQKTLALGGLPLHPKVR